MTMDPVRDGIESRLAGVEHTITWLHNIGDGKQRGSVRTTVDRARNGWTSGYFGLAEAQQRYLVDELPTPTRRFASSTTGRSSAAQRRHRRQSNGEEHATMTTTVSCLETHSSAQHFCRTIRSVDRIGPGRRVFVGWEPRVGHDEGLARFFAWLFPLLRGGKRLRRDSAQRFGSTGAAGASRSVTSGCAFKPVPDEFQVDVVSCKFDQLHREVGR